MTIILLNKLKKAVESEDPIASVKEIISEYEELHRLVKWKDQIVLSGESLEKHTEEIDRVNKLLEDNGYYVEMSSLDDLDKEMRDYFNDLQ